MGNLTEGYTGRLDGEVRLTAVAVIVGVGCLGVQRSGTNGNTRCSESHRC
jgi:hypothetical protein